MSFDGDYYHMQRDNKRDKRKIDINNNYRDNRTNQNKEIPSKLEGNYQGVIGDLQMF